MNQPQEEQVEEEQVDTTWPMAVYVLYLVSLLIGITAVVGVIIAYVNRSSAPEWLQEHYRFQIRTFWIGLLYAFVGALTALILIGWLILLFTLVWFIVRCVKGMMYLNEKRAPADPGSWMFG